MSMAKGRGYEVLVTVLAAIRVIAEQGKAAVRSLYKRVKRNKTACKVLRIAGVCLIVCLAIAAYTAVIYRVAAKQAVERYEVRLAEVRAEEAEAARLAAEQDPYTVQLNAEAESLARVLYGVRDNDTDDLKTYCYTAEDFANDHPKGTFMLGFGNHVATVKDGVIFDSFDSRQLLPIYYFYRKDD